MKESKDSINRCKEDKNDCKNEDHKNKKTQLNIRISKTEKRRLKRKAIKNGLNLSEYIRAMLSGGDRKQQGPGMVSQCVVICQDILNIVQEKYSCEDNSMLICSAILQGNVIVKRSIHVIAAEKGYLSHRGRPPDE